MMEKREEIIAFFTGLIREDPDKSVGYAAIETLMKVLELSKCKTVQELRCYMLKATDAMKSADRPVTAIASGSELFLRFITLTNLDNPSFDECRKLMMSRGQTFIENLSVARLKAAEKAAEWIDNNYVILTNSKSRVVLKAFELAAAKNINFQVYVTRSADNKGEEMYNDLKKLNIKCTLINDSSIGYFMRLVKFCMVGAEGVCQSGGIINKTGTFPMAICAHHMNKKVYVVAESFKFTTLCPLNNQDLPDEYKYTHSMLVNGDNKDNPIVDYTPPEYIESIFTDIGIFYSAAAVIDVIQQLYV